MPDTDTTVSTTPDPIASAMAEVDNRPTVTTDEIPDFVETLLANIGTEETPDAKPESAAAPEAKPAETPTPKPATSVDDIPEKPPGQTTAAAEVKWGELRNELKTVREDLQREREARAAEAARVAQIAELEERAKLYDAAEKELSIARVEATREYKRVVDEPLEALGTVAAEIAKRAEVSEDALLDAIGERNREKQAKLLTELTATMNESDKYRVYRMVDDAASIFAKRDKLHEQAAEARKEAEARATEETTKQEAERKRAYQSAVDTTLSKLKDRVPFVPLKEGETMDAFLEGIKAKATASDFNTAAPDVQAFSVAAALMFPRLIEQFRAEKASRVAAEKRIQELHGASPGPGTAATVPAPSEIDDFVASTMAAVGHR